MNRSIRCFLLAFASAPLLLIAATPSLGQSQRTVNGSNGSELTSTKKLVSAKSVYLMTAARVQSEERGGALWDQKLTNPDAALTELTKKIEKWGRFVIIADDPKKADLVLLVMEWKDPVKWGEVVICRNQLFVFEGGTLPNEKSQPLWTGDPEKWGKWNECSGAGEPVKELRKEIEKADKAAREVSRE